MGTKHELNGAMEQMSGSAVAVRKPVKPIIYVVRGRPGKEDRGALPAGHRLSWGMITDGTVLQDAAYPYPVFVP